MKNAGENIKIMATLLLILELVVGVIWLIIALYQYFSIVGAQDTGAISILLAIIYPACLILGSIVPYFLMYGFGQLVENSDILVTIQSKEFRTREFKEMRDDINNVQLGK